MNKHDDREKSDWLDHLDTILAGEMLPPEEDRELLPVAIRLATGLAFLQKKARTTIPRQPRSLFWYHRRSGERFSTRSSHLRPGIRLAALVIWLAIGLIGSASTVGIVHLWQGAQQVIQTSTSLEQINGISVTALSPPHAGLKPLPLLPSTLPTNIQAAFYGAITDPANPKIMTAFVADYRRGGQDVQLFEQISDGVLLSTTAQHMQIGTQQGLVFQDDAGNHAVQWEQAGMLCQLTSKLPVALLLQLASVFQPITSWEVILS